MSIDAVIREAVIKLTVDAKKSTKELKDFTKGTDETAEAMKKAAEQAKAVQKQLDVIGLGAKNNSEQLKKIGDGLHSWAGRGINAIDGFAKKLAPWNQAMELGGKALKLAEAGLDSYAETSADAAKQVKALTDEFNGYKQAVLAGVGAATVTIAGHLRGAEEIKKQYIEIENTKFFKIFLDPVTRAQFVGGGGFGSDEGGAFKAQKNVIGAVGVFGDFKNTLTDLAGNASWNGLDYNLGRVADGFATAAATAKKAREENARWVAEFKASQAGNNARNFTDTIGTAFSAKSINGDIATSGAAGDFGQFGLDNGNAITQEQYMRQLGIDISGSLSTAPTDQEPTFLERLGLDKPSEISAATTAIQGLAAGMQSAFQMIGEGSLSVGDALKKGLGIAVHALGDKLAAFAAAEAVEGAAMLLTLNPAGALHLGAAGLYGAGAVAAYAAASRLSGGGGGAAPSVSTSGATAAAAGYAGSSTSYYLGAGTPQPGGQTVNQYIGYVDEDSPRLRQRRAERMVNLGTQRTSVGGSF